MHPKSLYMDCLHVVDLGIAMHVCGNVLFLLCYDGMLPHTAAANMDYLWKEIDKLYHQFDVTSQFPHLGLTNFCNPISPHADFPKLKGKGAQIRHLVPLLAVIWKKNTCVMAIGKGMIGLLKRCLIALIPFIIC